jgi:hypothetical protein
MKCKCQIIEKENNVWIITLSGCVSGHQSFGPFESKYEVEAYLKEYLQPYITPPEYYDFEHPETRPLLSSIKNPPFKERLWDFESYKIMAWRNAGFRSRK